jgi:predicted amidophosphoribosyltransferase
VLFPRRVHRTQGFAFSATNQLIFNFKKGMERQGRPEWPHKARAIQTVEEALRAALNDRTRQTTAFVPVPPSKAKNDPLYDDRLVQVLRGIWPAQATDIREVILQPKSSDAAHDREQRPRPAELEARYVIDRGLLNPKPQILAVVDDLLTTGAHFVAVRNMLRREFPDIRIMGIFIARRVPEAVDVEDFET